MATVKHKKSTVVLMFEIGIFQNTECTVWSVFQNQVIYITYIVAILPVPKKVILNNSGYNHATLLQYIMFICVSEIQ